MLTHIYNQLRRGEVTACSLAETSLAGIQAMNAELNAFLYVDAEAVMRCASEADERIRCGDSSPLCGIPVALKDNLAVAGVPMCCASRVLENFVPSYSACAWERLAQSGAVFLGKTNMDEFAMGAGGETSAFGPCRNPWDSARVAGGSSSGSAAAVAGGMAYYALGSDTGGSVRVPAAFCGIVGLKPTYGRVSRRGLTAFASSLDQIGILSHSVRDSALVLSVIAGKDAGDSTTSTRPMDFLPYPTGVRGLRIGVPAGISCELSPAMADVLESGCAFLQKLGVKTVSVTLPSLDMAYAAYYLISACEASSNLARFDGLRYGNGNEADETFAQICLGTRQGFGEEVRRRILTGTFALSAAGRKNTYERACRFRQDIKNALHTLFADCDLILMPTVPDAAYPIGSRTGDAVAYRDCDRYTVPASLAGLPAISVPVTVKNGLPCALQLMAPAFREDILFCGAAALEEMGKHGV